MTRLKSKLVFYLIICFITIYADILAQDNCNDTIKMQSVSQQVKYLKHYYDLVLSSDEQEKYEKMFFCSFPNTFKRMEEIFGYDDNSGAAPLYYHGEILELFYNLKSIEKIKYYNKYINICINGEWKADNISECFGLYNKFFSKDSIELLSVLERRDSNSIKSVFKFLFDGPHPSQRKKDYERLYAKLMNYDEDLANLLKIEYYKLIEEECNLQ